MALAGHSLTHTPQALAGGRFDHGLLGDRVDGRHLVGADTHAGEAGGALVLVDLGHHAAGFEGRLGEDGGGATGGRVGLADRLVDALRVVGAAAQEDALAGEVDGAQLDVRFEEEAVALERHLEHLRQLGGAVVGDRRSGQHEQVERHLEAALQVGVGV